MIPALAYTNGLVIDGSGPTLEVLNAADGTRLYGYTMIGPIYGAPSISNGIIYIGTADGQINAFGTKIVVKPPADPRCPGGWICQDIGNPAPAGTETVNGQGWQVTAGGAGVAGGTDQFRLTSQYRMGDQQITAGVSGLLNMRPTGQAGLMVRQNDDPGSPYYAVLVQPNNVLVVQYRIRPGFGPIQLKKLVTGALPVNLEIQRIGDSFAAATSTDGTHYTLVPGSSIVLPLPTISLFGLATSSGANNTGAAATYQAVAPGPLGAAPVPTAPATPCPAGWVCGDIGNPLLVGDQALKAGVWTVKGAGGGIGNYSDQLHFVWNPLAADATVSAHVTQQTNTSPIAKTGVMLRQSTDASSPYYGAFLAPDNSLLVQARTTLGLRTQTVAKVAAGGPTYVSVQRWRNIFTTYTSPDGVNWTYLPGSNITIVLGPLLGGLAVSSNNPGAIDTATLNTVVVAATAVVPPVRCPDTWSCADIGNPLPPGDEALGANGTWTVRGTGDDIWSVVDRFHFDWQSLAADGLISARVASQTPTDPWAKSGVMLRQTTDPASPYYAIFTTLGHGIAVQYRATQGGDTGQSLLAGSGVPTYLMAARTGNVFTAFSSTDGVNWAPVPGSAIRLPNISGAVLAGLAITSHNTAAIGTGTFDTVQISTAAPPPYSACPSGWACGDIGGAIQIGSQSLNNGTWTVGAVGADIWLAADEFHLVSQGITADGTVGGRVASQGYSDKWAKAGFMLRQSTDPGSPYYFAFVTPGNGISVQYRTAQGANALQLATAAGVAPAYLEVARSGSTYTAYTSTDGVTWTPIAGSTVVLNIPGPLLGGIAATSHNSTGAGTVTLTGVSVSQAAPPPPNGCPGGWTCADVGNPTPAGGQTVTGGTWSISAGGADIFGTADQFHFASQALAADGSISAQLTAQTNTDPWAKAGMMIRQSTDPGAAYYAVFATPSNGIAVQYRSTQGALAQGAGSIAGVVPTYLKVTRAGTTYTAYTSTDGVTWTAIPGSAVTLNMPGSLLQGIAVTSHNSAASCTATFDSIITGP